MSFSAQVKNELLRQLPSARHCQLAELAAILLFNARYYIEGDKRCLQIKTENEGTARKCFTILQKAFNIEDVSQIMSKNQNIFIKDDGLVIRILQAVKQWDENRGYLERESIDTRLFTGDCCRRAFLRGCFLSAGSISTPEKFYHLEIVCSREDMAEQIRENFHILGIEAKIILRKHYYVVYMKEGNQISDALGIMEAPAAVLEFEQVRVFKDVRNRVNRKVNCETANINKTAIASATQLEAIRYLEQRDGLYSLPEPLEAVARARLEKPEASLQELGESLNPPVGKSGVNHRLRKIKALADQYRAGKD